MLLPEWLALRMEKGCPPSSNKEQSVILSLTARASNAFSKLGAQISEAKDLSSAAHSQHETIFHSLLDSNLLPGGKTERRMIDEGILLMEQGAIQRHRFRPFPPPTSCRALPFYNI